MGSNDNFRKCNSDDEGSDAPPNDGITLSESHDTSSASARVEDKGRDNKDVTSDEKATPSSQNTFEFEFEFIMDRPDEASIQPVKKRERKYK